VKTFWGATSAAEDLGLSKRHTIRYLGELGIEPAILEMKPGSQGHNPHRYILGPLQMELLRSHAREHRKRGER